MIAVVEDQTTPPTQQHLHTPLFGNVNAMFDEMTLANDARKERRKDDSGVMSVRTSHNAEGDDRRAHHRR